MTARPISGIAALVLALASTGCVSTTPRSELEGEERRAASHLAIGVDHLSNGRSALALREFLAAEQLDPRNARIHYALADAYLARGKREEAQHHLRESLEIHEGYHDARLSLSAVLLTEERYAEAAAECERLLDDPTFAEPWRALGNLAWAEFRQGKVDQARARLALAQEFRADYWPAALGLAILENEQGRKLEAVRLLRDIIAMQPGPGVESEVNYRLAEIYVALGKRREAMGHLTASVAKFPNGPWAKKSQEYLKLLH